MHFWFGILDVLLVVLHFVAKWSQRLKVNDQGQDQTEWSVKAEASTTAGRQVVAVLSTSVTNVRLIVFNCLSDEVVSAPTLSSFRRRLKRFLFQQSYPDIVI